MSPSLAIAIRFLLAKKRSMMMSLGGIAFGVGFFIVTQAQVSGFQEFFIQTILGTDGAIRIQDKFQEMTLSVEAASADGGASGTSFKVGDRTNRRYVEGVEFPEKVIDAISKMANVKAAAPVLTGNIFIQGPLRNATGQVYGIDIDAHLTVSDLARQVKEGSMDEFRTSPMSILIGRKLAERMNARVGDSMLIQASDLRNRYRVAGIYETGVSEIDKQRIFMGLSETRSLLKKPHGASFVQVATFDREKALGDALTIESVTFHAASAWQEREKVWLDVFKALRISAGITVSSIILISGLGMFNTLAMIVMEKTREIAILRSMGYTRSDISSIFILQGLVVLAIGTLAGFAMGGGLTYAISVIPLGISGIFTTDHYVVSWSALHYIYAAGTATVIVLFACVAPARRAANLEPGDVIRGTSL